MKERFCNGCGRLRSVASFSPGNTMCHGCKAARAAAYKRKPREFRECTRAEIREMFRCKA